MAAVILLVVLIPLGLLARLEGQSSSIRGVTPGAAPTQTPVRSQLPAPRGGIALGVTIHEQVPNVPGTDTQLMDWFAHLVGRMPAMVNTGSDWVHDANFSPTLANNILQRGAIPMWTWLPDDYNKGLSQPSYRLRTIAKGAFDPYIRKFARDVKAWGHPLMIRFAHEMNGNWYSYNTTKGNPNGNTPADLIAAWRHIHDIFHAVGATNVEWVWCVNVDYPGSEPIKPNYPGDAYVDWVALDGYNWGNMPGHTWQSLYQVFGSSYRDVTAFTKKPVMIAETGSVEQGGNKADWIKQGFLYQLPNLMPRVRVIMWFEAKAKGDWRVHSSAAALKAFRAVVASPLYKGKLLPAATATAKATLSPRAKPSPHATAKKH